MIHHRVTENTKERKRRFTGEYKRDGQVYRMGKKLTGIKGMEGIIRSRVLGFVLERAKYRFSSLYPLYPLRPCKKILILFKNAE